ncbi:uncharacterized protein LOC112555176 isoform X2 [Pomacea canaliculata]|uniref:uncharacterized protein LOC112555176 isoform X2 n=1 Tax=Pomacea canaliculata TaxID=400727 RepID=UPI000D72CD18|nr:uncharacterized protein LOC112555176 isoform X2 [Pomacea canaliculata]
MAHSIISQAAKSPAVVYMQAYFVTIATILGTGILGLPVTLTQSGLYPFLISFILDAVMQSILIHFFTDLLQRAYAMQLHDPEEEAVPLSKMVEEDFSLDSEDSGDIVMKEIRIPEAQERATHFPNLHLLGKLFLPCGIQQMFDALIILQFHFYVIPVFVWLLTLGIIFAIHLIQPVVSILTFLKGSVLLATTLVTFYVGMSVGRKINNDFTYIGAPFLMGTVALGGAINTMPFTYEKIQYKKKQIANYRLAVHLGLWTCVVLNILWCWSVLYIVPQTIAQACAEPLFHQPSSLVAANVSSAADLSGIQCYGKLSLQSAKLNGEISTLPLTELLTRDFPKYLWVAVLIEVFIMISITVSFLTIGSALHHTLTGVVQTVVEARGLNLGPNSSRCCAKQWLITSIVSILAFAVVFIVAMLDPQGFVDILEKFASLTLNAQAGIFVFLMLLSARKHRSLHIPLPLPDWAYLFMWTIPIFFGSAVLVDIYSTIRDILYPEHLVPVLMNISAPIHSSGVPVSTLANTVQKSTVF